MNTGIRRFILRLVVGLLAFLIGVAAVWAISGLNPFQDSSRTEYYRHKRGYPSRGAVLMPEPAYVYPVYHEHETGCRMRSFDGEMPSPPPPPHMHADAPPPPPRPIR